MKRALISALLGVALACSDRTEEPTGPSTIPPPSSIPSRVALSGTVSAAENGTPIRVRVQIVEGINAGRETSSNDAGRYELANLEPGTFTLLFTTGEYRDLQRTEEVRADTTLNVQLERKGLTLSGVITTQWGEPIDDAGVEAVHNGRVAGGGGPSSRSGLYRIPTLPPADYIVRVRKWGYVEPQRPITLTSDATLDFVLDRVRISIFGSVREAAPCTGAIQDARVEIISGPDAGTAASSTATGYQLRNGARVLNWGKFTMRASKTGYVPADVSMDVLPPGSQCPITMPSCPWVSAPSEIQQDFQLQRTTSC